MLVVKCRLNVSLERYKTRLVAKEYIQIYYVDYMDTFALVAKLNTIRVLLFPVTIFNLYLKEFNVNHAFFHDNLVEEIYIDISPGFKERLRGNKVCRLKKILYCVKQ